jgi:hypothetical protein
MMNNMTKSNLIDYNSKKDVGGVMQRKKTLKPQVVDVSPTEPKWISKAKD